MWDLLAFAARYGRQPLDLLMSLDYPTLHQFVSALARMIEKEGRGVNTEDD